MSLRKRISSLETRKECERVSVKESKREINDEAERIFKSLFMDDFLPSENEQK